MVQLSTSWQMLNSKTVSISGFTGEFQLWGRYSTQDIANNRTKVHYSWDVNITYGWVSSYDAEDYVTGAGWNGAAYRTYSSSGTLRSWEGWINHASDGTGSGSCSGRTYMGGMGVDTDWVSASFTLPTIPRASQPSASPNPITIKNATNTLTVNSNRKASSFTHTIKIQVGSWSLQNTGVGASTTFNIPYSVIAQFSATSKTASGTITCTTYSGSTNVGTKTANFTLQVDSATDHANIGTITTADTNPTTSAIVSAGQFVYGQSTLEATIPLTVSGSYTQLASAKVTCGNTTQNYTLSGTSQTITFTKNKVDVSSLTVTVTDKRGNSVSKTATWQLLPYQPLTLTGTVGRPSATGSTATGQVTGMAYGGTYGNTANSLNISYEWKLHSDANYTAGQDTYTQTIADGQQNYTQAMTFAESFDYQNQYDIRFTVSDLFSTATYVAQLMQGLPIISWDENEVDVFGNLHIHDRDNPTVWQDVMQGFDAVFEHSANKNILRITAETTTKNGITFTLQNDGSIKVTGTATATANFTIGTLPTVSGQEYIMTGCPSTGGQNKYRMTAVGYGYDYGEGYTFTGDGASHDIAIDVYTGAGAVNLTFYPMIRDVRIASDDFVTYCNPNENLWGGQYRFIRITQAGTYQVTSIASYAPIVLEGIHNSAYQILITSFAASGWYTVYTQTANRAPSISKQSNTKWNITITSGSDCVIRGFIRDFRKL